jgi:hypothetical protein
MDFIVAALQLTPAIVAAGEDIAQFVTWSIGVYDQDGGPTDADWDELQAKEAALRAKLTPAQPQP